MNLTKYSALLALILAVVFWGITVPVIKYTLEYIPPFTLATLRFGTAALILLPFIIKNLRVKRKHLPTLIASGLIGISIHIGAFFLGIKETSALNAGILIGTTPIFTFIAASYFLKEKLSKSIIASVVLGTAGILVVIGKDIFISGLNLALKGDFLILLSMLAFVIYEIISKKLFKYYKPATVTFYSFAIGTLTFIPFSVAENMNGVTWISNLPFEAVLGLLYGILIASLAAYTLWEWGLSKIPASSVGIFLYLDPIAATIASIYLLGERLSFPFVIGATLIASGVLLSQLKKPHLHRHRPPHK